MTGFVTRLLTIWSEMKPIWSEVIIYPNSSESFLDNLKIGFKEGFEQISADLVIRALLFYRVLESSAANKDYCKTFPRL